MSHTSAQWKVKSKIEIDQKLSKFRYILEKKNITDAEIKECFFELFGIFKILCHYYDVDDLKGFAIYRARLAEQINTPSNINQYGAPPTYEDFGIGRANLKNRNVFYGSSNALGALLETKEAHPGNKFYVGRWIFQPEQFKNKKIGISSFIDLNKKHKGKWEELLRNNLKNLDDISAYFYSALGKLFATPEEEMYPITAFLADQITYMNRHPKAPSILQFPSVINDYFLNFAIHPDIIKDCFRLEKVIKLEVKNEIKEDTLKIEEIEFGILNKNKSVDFYKSEFDFKNSIFNVDGLKCTCGESIKFNDAEKLTLTSTINNSTSNLKVIVGSLITKQMPTLNSLEIIENWFEKEGVKTGVTIEHPLRLENWSIKENNIEHKNLIASCNIIHPLKFIKSKNHSKPHKKS